MWPVPLPAAAERQRAAQTAALRGAGLQQEWRRLAHRQVGDVLELDEGEHDDGARHFPRAHLELVVRLLVLHVVKGQVVWLGLGLGSGLGLGLGLALTLTLKP